MTENQTEFNILGCSIRVKSGEDSDKKALEAINLLNDEIVKVKSKSPNMKSIDVAVLSALNLANKCLETQGEYRENIFALKAGVEDALQYVEQVSSNSGTES